MNESIRVGVLKGAGCSADYPAGIRYGERTVPADAGGQGLSGYEFHDQVEKAAGLPGVRGLNYVRVVQSANSPHLPVEAGHGRRIARELRAKNLESDNSLEPGVQGLICRAHATLTNLLEKPILAQPVARQQRVSLRVGGCDGRAQ
jgi:hypothetical protein